MTADKNNFQPDAISDEEIVFGECDSQQQDSALDDSAVSAPGSEFEEEISFDEHCPDADDARVDDEIQQDVAFDEFDPAMDDSTSDQFDEFFATAEAEEEMVAWDESDAEATNFVESAAHTDFHPAFDTLATGSTDPGDDSLVDMTAVRSSFSGTLLSIVLHLWLVFTLAGIIREPRELLDVPPIDTRVVETVEEEEPEEVIKYELANPNEKELEVREVINAASVGQVMSQNPSMRSAPTPTREILPTEIQTLAYDIPEGMEVDDRLVVKGATGEALIQMEAALDRVTWEIAQNLQERKVLVVWLIDASASLIEQRKAIARRLRRVYGELEALEVTEQIPRFDKPLLTGVVTFGEKTNFITREPTDNFDTILDAVENAPTDDSGVENVFRSIYQVMGMWKKYRTERGRRIMIITVTDEAGDDFSEYLEPAIARCRRYGARTYVIGPSAVFGRRQGFIPYVAPENGRTYQIPIDLGPETAVMTNVNLPFWYNGPQYTYLSAGFAPYALARAVSETGGIYFMTTMTTMSGLSPIGVFDSITLKPFMPDYSFGSLAEYGKDLAKHPIRKAVVNAARLSMEFPAKGTPALTIRVTPQNFKQALSQAQQTVAESQLMIDNILMAFPPGIDKKYDAEPSARWRMSFSLAYGRLLAQKARCLEYNFALAKLKNDYTIQDITTDVNEWRFHPDEKINYATGLKRVVEAAKKHLQLIIVEAPGTPWAVLASRELQYPLGIRIEERFNPPVQRGTINPNRPTKKQIQLANDRKTQIPKARPKPIKPKLPKL